MRLQHLCVQMIMSQAVLRPQKCLELIQLAEVLNQGQLVVCSTCWVGAGAHCLEAWEVGMQQTDCSLTPCFASLAN